MTASVDDELAAIAQRESGNQNVYTKQHATDPGYTASGYYQIVDPTWREGAGMAGVDTGQYPHAISAPFEVQNAVAKALYARYGAKPWASSLGSAVAQGQPAPLPTPPVPPPAPATPLQAQTAQGQAPIDPALLDAMYNGQSVAGGPSSLSDAFVRAAQAGQRTL